MRVASTRLRVVLAGLLVVSATLFGVGATLERQHSSEHAAETSASGSHSEAAESGTESSGGSTEPGPSGTGERTREHSETEPRLLGVDTESVGLEVVAIGLSLGLAIAVWLSRKRAVLLAVIVWGLVFAVGDTRELAHQLSESQPGLVTIAAVLIALHLAAATVAAVLAIRRAPATAAITQPTS